MSDLKIYIIGPNLYDSLIRPWSVVGKYVRRCVIIYEKMQFDKLVDLCKKAGAQFKSLSSFISHLKTRQQNGKSGEVLNQQIQSGGASTSGAGSSTGGGLFLHDESNLTITNTSEWFNR